MSTIGNSASTPPSPAGIERSLPEPSLNYFYNLLFLLNYFPLCIPRLFCSVKGVFPALKFEGIEGNLPMKHSRILRGLVHLRPKLSYLLLDAIFGITAMVLFFHFRNPGESMSLSLLFLVFAGISLARMADNGKFLYEINRILKDETRRLHGQQVAGSHRQKER